MPRFTTLIVTNTNAAQLATSTAGAMALAGFGSLKIAPPNLLQHTLSAAFPRPNDVEFQNLKDSITNIGVQVPITIHDGQVIDGWSRYRAASELGMPCPCIELPKDVDPQHFAASQTARRNLTAAQAAMVITAIYEWHPPHRIEGHTQCEVKTNAKLAELAGVHPNTISQAKVVKLRASSEVQTAVLSGGLGLPKAIAIAKMPKEKQAAAIDKPLESRKPKQEMPTLAVVQPPAPEDTYAELDAAKDQIDFLQAELVVSNMGQVTEEEKGQAAAYIEELKAEIKTLQVNLKAVTTSRDSLMSELAQVKRQCISQQKKLKHLNTTRRVDHG